MFDTTDANCATADPDMFFLDAYNSVTFQLAVDVCALCPIVEACLDFSLENEEEFGIWGGAGIGIRRLIYRDKNHRDTHLKNLADRRAHLEKVEKATINKSTRMYY